MFYTEDRSGNLILAIRVVPRAAANGIAGVLGDELKVRIQAPPVDGEANDCLIRFLAKQFDIPRSSISLLSGGTGRSKRLKVTNAPAKLRRGLTALLTE